MRAAQLSVAPSASVLLAILISLALPACGQQWLGTGVYEVEPGTIRWERLLTYRKLRIADFRAEFDLDDLSEHAQAVGALTMVMLSTSPGGRTSIIREDRGSRSFYIVKHRTLSFGAYFVPADSWWNPRLPRSNFGYVRQHEQVHFALAEVAARGLNRRAPELRESLEGRGDTVREAEAALTRASQAVLDKAMQQLAAQNERFDAETSIHGYDKLAQRRWATEASAELKVLAAYTTRPLEDH